MGNKSKRELFFKLKLIEEFFSLVIEQIDYFGLFLLKNCHDEGI